MRSEGTAVAMMTTDELLEYGREYLRQAGVLGDVERHVRYLRTIFPKQHWLIEGASLSDQLHDSVVEFIVIHVMELFSKYREIHDRPHAGKAGAANNVLELTVDEEALWFDVASLAQEFFGLSEHGVSLVDPSR